ncbi:unnamed protein product [Camellia sinensis]
MALDYPPEKLAVYLSDDGGSPLTLYAVKEACLFGKSWIPFCRGYGIKTRCPEQYFESLGDDDERVVWSDQLKEEEEEIKFWFCGLRVKTTKRKVFDCHMFRTISSSNHTTEEFQNMLLLVKSMGVQHVEIVVELKSDIGQSSSLGLVRVGVEEEIDALRRFCHHKEKVLLSAPWANGITHVGQRFVGGAQEFRDVLCKYAIQCGFQFTYGKNETTRVTAVCAMREERGCLWAIHCRAQRANDFFYIKSFSDVHTCGTDVQTSKNPRVSSDLVSSTIFEIVRDKPLTRPCDVVTILKRDYGLDVSYHVVWLAVEKAKAGIHGDYSLSFDQLWWYSDAVMRYNPGVMSILTMMRVVNSFVISLCHSLRVFLGSILVGLYYSWMEHSSKESTKASYLRQRRMTETMCLFPVAFAIVDSETTANWSWFLHELGKVVDGIDNGFRDHLVSSLADCACEPTVVGFHEKLAKLKEESKQRAHDFFKDLAPEHWANSYFRGMRYGEMTSNAVKSFNNWIKEARNLPITQMVDTICTQLMRQMSARRDQANKWKELICPTFETRLMDSFNDSRSWQVSKANENVFEVHSIPSVTVDVARRTCSCFKWQINGFPCDHAVVAIQKSRYNLNDCVEHYFHVQTYRAVYSGAIFPIPSVEKSPFDPMDFTIYPLTVKRPPGRPKKNRIPSRGEKLKQIRYRRCDKLGSHNQKSCKEPI